MQEITGITGGVSHINQGSSGTEYFYNSTKTHKNKSVNLHSGEIIHGTIADVINPNEAIVNLPIGNLKAQLNGELEKGDTLFFRVQDVTPAIVLKIYAVSIKVKDKLLENKEILRILNLPENDFFSNIINFLKEFQSTISRDDLINMFKIFNNLKHINFSNINSDSIFRLLLFINELNLEHPENYFKKLLPIFNNPNNLLAEFSVLNSLLDTLPKHIKEKLKLLFNTISNENIDIKTSANFFNIYNSDTEQTLFEILADFVNSYNDQEISISPAYSSARNILDTIESQYIYNALAIKNNLALQWFFPFFINNNLHFAIIQSNIDKSNQLLKFSFETDTFNLGDILIEGSSYSNSLSISIFTDSIASKDYLSKNLYELNSSLSKQNYFPLSIHLYNSKNRFDNILESIVKTKDKNFQVVI